MHGVHRRRPQRVSGQPGHCGTFVHRLGEECTSVLRVEDGADGPAHHTRHRRSRRNHDPLLPEIVRNIPREQARPRRVRHDLVERSRKGLGRLGSLADQERVARAEVEDVPRRRERGGDIGDPAQHASRPKVLIQDVEGSQWHEAVIAPQPLHGTSTTLCQKG